MRYFFLKGSLSLVVFILGFCPFVYSQEFSADMIGPEISSNQVIGKIYVGKDKVKIVQDGAQSMIIRLDKKVAWVLMPDVQAYIELPLKDENLVSYSSHSPTESESVLIGTEQVDGRSADKFRVVFNAEGKKMVIFKWIDKELNFPVKITAEDGSWGMKYANIQLAMQPERLFEVPVNFEKKSARDLNALMQNAGESSQ